MHNSLIMTYSAHILYTEMFIFYSTFKTTEDRAVPTDKQMLQ